MTSSPMFPTCSAALHSLYVLLCPMLGPGMGTLCPVFGVTDLQGLWEWPSVFAEVSPRTVSALGSSLGSRSPLQGNSFVD